jgi:uncharacterized membrane protein
MLHVQERFTHFLPLIYLGYALPITIAFAVIAPPFMVPDENHHFYRAVQIAEGHLYASRSPDLAATFNNSSGGFIDSTVVDLGENPIFFQMGMHAEVPFDPATARREHLFDLPWSDQVKFVAFPNIAPYPFTSYLPAVAGLLIGKACGLSVLQSFFLARFCKAFTCLVLSAIAIHLVSRGKFLLTCLLSLPMTLFLFSSLSQDAMLITYTALSIGLLNRFSDATTLRPARWMLGAILALLVGVAIGRPPYVTFILIGGLFIYSRTKSWKPAVIGSALAILCVLAYMLSVRYLGTRTALGSHPDRQIAFIFHHPIQTLNLLFSTLQLSIPFKLREMIAILGWGTVELPDSFYTWVTSMLFILFLADFRPGDSTVSFWPRIGVGLLSALAVLLILISLFVMWSDERNPYIIGEGRYYIPITLMLTLLMGNRDASWMGRFPLPSMRICATMAALAVIIITDFATCMVCLARYYY